MGALLLGAGGAGWHWLALVGTGVQGKLRILRCFWDSCDHEDPWGLIRSGV